MARAITFVVPGRDETQSRGAGPGAAPAALPAPALPPAFARGKVQQSVRVHSQRAGGGDVRVTAEADRDVVALHLANGPTLFLHPETARDLLLAQAAGDAPRGAGEADSGAIRIPAQLAWRRLEQAGATRGAARGLGDVLLSLVEVIRGPAADLAAKQIVKRVDDQVEEGVYRLEPRRLEALRDQQGSRVERIPGRKDKEKPVLVFIHGTFSTTDGTFGKLWMQHPQRVRKLFGYYSDGEREEDRHVYALDHRTLGASPIANALTLAKALPKKTPIHLVTHSRGGLVAEVLARACAPGTVNPAELKRLFPGADHEEQRHDLAELAKHLQGVNVSRVVRVACPARGTLLASKRLDAYLSVFKWTLELAGLPVVPQVVDFLAEVAQRRADWDLIPGLAAQIPDSPLVQWLHAPAEQIPGELRVIAGDIAGDSVVSWLKTLLSDSFYRTDNDLVVQTSSMYGGSPRGGGAEFVFDQGGKVSHFAYFSNERTAEAVVEGLTSPAPNGFRRIGPLSWAGKDAGGERGLRGTGADPAKPALFVLPGILGSNLKQGDERIWLSFRIVFGLTRLAYKPGDGIQPDGPVGASYDDLVEYLSATHEVIEFPFDWRKPIEEEARRLADAVENKLDERKAANSKAPVRFLAHSMGGLVARAMQLERPKIWERMLSADGARVLMLGTPNGGSWAPMQVLSGDDSFGNMLVGFGAPFSQEKARNLMAAMPGFLQLQAKLTDPALALDRRDSWQKLAEADYAAVRRNSVWHSDALQINECRWGIPTQAVLDQAVKLRERLDKQRDSTALVPAAAKVLLVVGKSDFTPDGYDAEGADGFVYLDAQEAGDGRVTLASARLPNVPTWTLDCEHGKLPDDKRAFRAYLELLETGSTKELPALEAAASRGAAAAAGEVVHVRSRRGRIPVVPRPPELPEEALDATDRQTRDSAPAPVGAVLEVRVVNNNLAFVRPPLLIGHYRADQLTGTEEAMDSLIGGEMQEMLNAGSYPSEPGTHHIFRHYRSHPDDEKGLPRPAAVIVIGLGDEGDFQASELVKSVREGVIAASQWAKRDPANLPQFEIAATLIGSGGPEMSAGQSAQLIAQGVREANVTLLRLGGKWPLVGRLQLVELYLDRAAEALRALQAQAAASPGLFRVKEKIEPGVGALRRPLDAGYRGASYDYIRALAERRDGEDEAVIRYALDTRRARTEVRSQQPQGRLVRELSKLPTRQAIEDRELGLTLFRLLVPVELEPYLGGAMEMVIEVDEETAGIPWELMDAPSGADSRPWAVRAKLLRKLRTTAFRPQPVDAGKAAGVLVIGEPKCDPKYPRLPGARREANAVRKLLADSPKVGPRRLKSVIAPDDPGREGASFDQIVKVLQAGSWRVLHVAGHGDEPLESDEPGKSRPSRGVVLSNGTFIGPAEINALRQVPELVFVNCCHLGASAAPLVMSYSRPAFAASVAQALIEVGVRCVVAAGWAVDDAVAEAFATTFYDRLLKGERFMDAVALAREEAQSMGGNTWAAYQCYGDPNWRLDPGSDAQRPAALPDTEFASVTSPAALILALDNLAVMCKSWIPRPKLEAQRTKIRYLESVHGATWGDRGEVAEAFAKAWTHAEDRASGIKWYTMAVNAEDGGASIKAIEQLQNLRVRVAAERVAAAKGAGAAAEQEVRHAIDVLERLLKEAPSMERASLCGSAHKRLAMILGAIGKPDKSTIETARRYYAEAEKLGAKSAGRLYPAMNVTALDVVLRAGLVPAGRFQELRDIIARFRDDPDFWSAVSEVELTLYEAVNADALAPKTAALVAGFGDLHKRWPAPWMWASVRDQAGFVLPSYARRVASAAEKKAAEALQTLLESYAPTPAQEVKPKTASRARSAPRRRARKS